MKPEVSSSVLDGEGGIPAGREFEGQFVELGFVEAHRHQHEDGGVEEDQDHPEEDLAKTGHAVPPVPRRRTPEKVAKIAMDDGEQGEGQRCTERPVEGLGELILDHRAHGDADFAAEDAGLHEGADDGHEGQHSAGNQAGGGKRDQDFGQDHPPARAKALSGFDNRIVYGDEGDVAGEDHVGQIAVNKADHDGLAAVEDGDGACGGSDPVPDVVKKAVLAQHHRPGEYADKAVGPEWQQDQDQQSLTPSALGAAHQGEGGEKAEHGAGEGGPQAHQQRVGGDFDQIGLVDEGAVVAQGELDRGFAHRGFVHEAEQEHRQQRQEDRKRQPAIGGQQQGGGGHPLR